MSAPVARTLYTVALYLVSPVVWLYLLYRSMRQPAYRAHWGERLGHYPPLQGSSQLVWIHAVSVGETRAAQSLVTLLSERRPDLGVLFTHMTPTGRDTSAALFGSGVVSVYLPYDFPGAVHRFVSHFKPALGIMMEMEVWPNLVSECAAEGVPVVLVNARLSERSFARAQRYGSLIRGALAQLRCIVAQTEADRARLERLGAVRITVAGNLKFDTAVDSAQQALADTFAARTAGRHIFLAAQTREGEESLFISAWKSAAVPPSWLLVLVPRHPQRFAQVEELVLAAGLKIQRRSDGKDVAPAVDVWLGDSMGEMLAYYSLAPIAFIGGSLLPFGAHNLIEATAVGCPVAIGPHTFNFSQAVADAIAAGAALPVANAAEFLSLVKGMLDDPEMRAQMSTRAYAFAQAHRGATERTYAALEALLPARGRRQGVPGL